MFKQKTILVTILLLIVLVIGCCMYKNNNKMFENFQYNYYQTDPYSGSGSSGMYYGGDSGGMDYQSGSSGMYYGGDSGMNYQSGSSGMYGGDSVAWIIRAAQGMYYGGDLMDYQSGSNGMYWWRLRWHELSKWLKRNVLWWRLRCGRQGYSSSNISCASYDGKESECLSTGVCKYGGGPEGQWCDSKSDYMGSQGGSGDYYNQGSYYPSDSQYQSSGPNMGSMKKCDCSQFYTSPNDEYTDNSEKCPQKHCEWIPFDT